MSRGNRCSSVPGTSINENLFENVSLCCRYLIGKILINYEKKKAVATTEHS